MYAVKVMAWGQRGKLSFIRQICPRRLHLLVAILCRNRQCAGGQEVRVAEMADVIVGRADLTADRVAVGVIVIADHVVAAVETGIVARAVSFKL